MSLQGPPGSDGERGTQGPPGDKVGLARLHFVSTIILNFSADCHEIHGLLNAC